MSQITKTTTREAVVVDNLTPGKFQKKNTITAMLRQKVKVVSHYPSAIHSNDLQDNIFSADQFDDTVKNFVNTDNRVAFIDVPVSKSIEQVAASIPETACLYKILSNAPILTNNHKNAIDRGITTLDAIADSQIVRYGEKDSKGQPEPKAGQIIPDSNGRVQYKKVFFSNTLKEDIDRRGLAEYPEYVSEAVKAELGVDADGVLMLEDEQVL